MRLKFGLVLTACSSFLVLGAAVLAETKVEVKGVHLCCGACVKGVATALKGMDGVKGVSDRESETVTITASDEATAQKALDALTAAGYHGDVDAKGLTIKAESNVPSGKVKSLSLNNTHNCCKACTNAIKKAVKSVPGVTGDTTQPKTAAFEVTGDFEAAAVVKALNDAGFHVQVKE
jgi:periplasmic mercuric ion binding protein